MAIGRLTEGKMVKKVAQHFRVSESAISRLRTKYRQTGTVKDRPRSGRPRKTTRREDNCNVMSSRRNRFLSSMKIVDLVGNATGTWICARTVRNKLRAARLRGRRPYVDVPLARNHWRERLNWARAHRQMDKTAVELFCVYGRVPFEFEFCEWKCTCFKAKWRTNGSC